MSSVQDVLSDDRVAAVLEAAIEWHRDDENQERMAEYDHVGWEAGDVGATGWELPQLQSVGLIEQSYDSGSSSYYRVVDVEEAERALNDVQTPLDVGGADDAVPTLAPDELFADVVGREEPKQWITRTIERGEPIHHLLIGEAGSGKSMMLDDLARLEGAVRVVLAGNQGSAAGVRDVLLEEQPDYLIVEEIEKGTRSDREALMTVCGQGYVTKTKAGERVEIPLETIVFAAGNDRERITPDSLVDRFMVWPFEPYDRGEFLDVCRRVLPRDYGYPTELAQYVGKQVYEQLDSTSVREAERIASLVETKTEVDRLIQARK